MLAVILFRESQCIRNNHFVIKRNAGHNLVVSFFAQVVVQSGGVDLLLAVFGMRQFGCQVTIVGQKQHTGGVAVKASNGVDALTTCVFHQVCHFVTFLRIIGSGNAVLGFVEQHVHFLLAAYCLVVELDDVSRENLGTEFAYYLTIYGNHSGLNEIVGLTTRANTCVGEEFVQTNRLRRVFVFLFILHAFLRRILGIGSGAALALFVHSGTTAETAFALLRFAAVPGLADIIIYCVRTRVSIGSTRTLFENRFACVVKARTRNKAFAVLAKSWTRGRLLRSVGTFAARSIWFVRTGRERSLCARSSTLRRRVIGCALITAAGLARVESLTRTAVRVGRSFRV